MLDTWEQVEVQREEERCDCLRGLDSLFVAHMKDREAYCQLRQGVEQCLDSNESILNVSWSDQCGANPTDLSTWERRNGQLLPEDLREFFLLWDGLTCRWDVVAHGREVIPLGCLRINPLLQLVPVDSTWLRNERDEPRPELPAAATSAGLRAFDLDAECECGRVLLLLGLAGPPRSCEIWFQDVGCELTRLASSFSDYFRMLCVSLGLPRWQYAHTMAGLDPTSRQWFRLLAPQNPFKGHLVADSLTSDVSAYRALSCHDASATTPSEARAPDAASGSEERSRKSSLSALGNGGGVLALGAIGSAQKSAGDSLSHTEALSLLDRARVGQQSTPRLVAAGNPRSAIALLNSGAHSVTATTRPPLCLGGPGSSSSSSSGCSRNSSATSTSSANHGSTGDGSGSVAATHHPRPSSGAAARPTGDPRRRLRRAGHAALLKRGGGAAVTGHDPAPEADE